MTTNVSSSTLAPRVGLDVGSLEALDDVVAEEEGVGEGLEREGVLRAGDHCPVGHGPERQDQMVVGQFAILAAGGHVDHPALQVDALNRRLAEPRAPQERADGKGAVSQVQGPRANLEQQRRHDEEVVATHQDDLDIGAALAKPLQVAGGVDPTEATAEYQDPSLRGVRVCTCCCRLAAHQVCLTQGLTPTIRDCSDDGVHGQALFSDCFRLVRRRPVGEDQGLVLANPSRRNRLIAGAGAPASQPSRCRLRAGMTAV